MPAKLSNPSTINKENLFVTAQEIACITTVTTIDFTIKANQTNEQYINALKSIDSYLSQHTIFNPSVVQGDFDNAQLTSIVAEQEDYGRLIIAACKLAKISSMQDAKTDQRTTAFDLQQSFLLSNLSIFMTLLYFRFRSDVYFLSYPYREALENALSQFRHVIKRYYHLIQTHIVFAQANDNRFNHIINTFNNHIDMLNRYMDNIQFDPQEMQLLFNAISTCQLALTYYPLIINSKEQIDEMNAKMKSGSVCGWHSNRNPLKRNAREDNSQEQKFDTRRVKPRLNDGRNKGKIIPKNEDDKSEALAKHRQEIQKLRQSLTNVTNQLILSQMKEQELRKQSQNSIAIKEFKQTNKGLELSQVLLPDLKNTQFKKKIINVINLNDNFGSDEKVFEVTQVLLHGRQVDIQDACTFEVFYHPIKLGCKQDDNDLYHHMEKKIYDDIVKASANERPVFCPTCQRPVAKDCKASPELKAAINRLCDEQPSVLEDRFVQENNFVATVIGDIRSTQPEDVKAAVLIAKKRCADKAFTTAFLPERGVQVDRAVNILEYAVVNNLELAVKYCLDVGIDPNSKTTSQNFTAVNMAIELHPKPTIFQIMINHPSFNLEWLSTESVIFSITKIKNASNKHWYEYLNSVEYQLISALAYFSRNRNPIATFRDVADKLIKISKKNKTQDTVFALSKIMAHIKQLLDLRRTENTNGYYRILNYFMSVLFYNDDLQSIKSLKQKEIFNSIGFSFKSGAEYVSRGLTCQLLDWSLEFNKQNQISFLRQCGLDLNQPIHTNIRPFLHRFAEKANTKICAKLLRLGAKNDVRDNYGKYAHEYVPRTHSNENLFMMLLPMKTALKALRDDLSKGTLCVFEFNIPFVRFINKYVGAILNLQHFPIMCVNELDRGGLVSDDDKRNDIEIVDESLSGFISASLMLVHRYQGCLMVQAVAIHIFDQLIYKSCLIPGLDIIFSDGKSLRNLFSDCHFARGVQYFEQVDEQYDGIQQPAKPSRHSKKEVRPTPMHSARSNQDGLIGDDEKVDTLTAPSSVKHTPSSSSHHISAYKPS